MISVSTAKRGSAIRVSVADCGSGIPQDELPRIRVPYYRGKSSKGTSGAGLGLYIADRIVAAHGGRLFIESAEGKGTKVVIDLPQVAGTTA
jgi:signal transduction histidine kinase